MRKTRFKSWQKSVALFLALVMLASPVLAQDVEKARAAAEMDAERNVSGGTWFLIGCVGGVTGLIVAYVIDSPPSSSALIGKSPEYVAAYTDVYRERAKSIRTKNTWTGCLTTGVVYIVYIMLLVSASSTSTE